MKKNKKEKKGKELLPYNGMQGGEAKKGVGLKGEKKSKTRQTS